MGLAWAGAIGAMACAVSSLGVPVSIIAPLTNSNALVALAVSAMVFREWPDLTLSICAARARDRCTEQTALGGGRGISIVPSGPVLQQRKQVDFASLSEGRVAWPLGTARFNRRW